MQNLNRVNWFKRSPVLSYAVAALGVTAAVIANRLLETYLLASPTVSLLLCAIIFATWFGGFGPGLAAIALSLLGFDYFFLAPIHSLKFILEDSLRVALLADTRPLCRRTDRYTEKYS
jgi:K+-sensing histidine kinase KdpD